eukprot:m51a1_g3584 hypothetical protein (752) ;mRNA; r:1131365-1146041
MQSPGWFETSAATLSRATSLVLQGASALPDALALLVAAERAARDGALDPASETDRKAAQTARAQATRAAEEVRRRMDYLREREAAVCDPDEPEQAVVDKLREAIEDPVVGRYASPDGPVLLVGPRDCGKLDCVRSVVSRIRGREDPRVGLVYFEIDAAEFAGEGAADRALEAVDALFVEASRCPPCLAYVRNVEKMPERAQLLFAERLAMQDKCFPVLGKLPKPVPSLADMAATALVKKVLDSQCEDLHEDYRELLENAEHRVRREKYEQSRLWIVCSSSAPWDVHARLRKRLQCRLPVSLPGDLERLKVIEKRVSDQKKAKALSEQTAGAPSGICDCRLHLGLERSHAGREVRPGVAVRPQSTLALAGDRKRSPPPLEERVKLIEESTAVFADQIGAIHDMVQEMHAARSRPASPDTRECAPSFGERLAALESELRRIADSVASRSVQQQQTALEHISHAVEELRGVKELHDAQAGETDRRLGAVESALQMLEERAQQRASGSSDAERRLEAVEAALRRLEERAQQWAGGGSDAAVAALEARMAYMEQLHSGLAERLGKLQDEVARLAGSRSPAPKQSGTQDPHARLAESDKATKAAIEALRSELKETERQNQLRWQHWKDSEFRLDKRVEECLKRAAPTSSSTLSRQSTPSATQRTRVSLSGPGSSQSSDSDAEPANEAYVQAGRKEDLSTAIDSGDEQGEEEEAAECTSYAEPITDDEKEIKANEAIKEFRPPRSPMMSPEVRAAEPL